MDMHEKLETELRDTPDWLKENIERSFHILKGERDRLEALNHYSDEGTMFRDLVWQALRAVKVALVMIDVHPKADDAHTSKPFVEKQLDEMLRDWNLKLMHIKPKQEVEKEE